MKFLLLGPVEVRSGPDHLELTSERQRSVLATLLLARGTVVAPHRLVEMVWGDTPPTSAEANLRTYISQLRRQLSEIADGDRRIAARSGGYLIDAQPEEVDVDCFVQLSGAGRQTLLAGDADRGVDLLGQALALWRGQPLANIAPTAAVEAEVQSLSEARLAAAEQLTRARLRLGSHSEAVGDLRRLTAQYPLHESLWALLMNALAGAGQQAAALAAYATVRDRLASDLGAEPGPELRRTHLAVLRRDTATIPANNLNPAQLPRRGTGFCGRIAELQELDQIQQRRDGPRLGVVAGAAGVGKTTLVTYWACRANDQFPDGQLYADLGNEREPLSILARFLRALGVPQPRIPNELAEAQALYRSVLAAKAVLCVFDNVTEGAQVRPLLPNAEAGLTLVISRNRLDELVAIDGAHRITLDVLPMCDAVRVLSVAIGTERAHGEPEAIRKLASACARLPLALRITGAQLAYRPDRRVADHLAGLLEQGVLGSLTLDGTTASAVRAAYDLSYQALDSATQRIFRMLSLIPGPDFTSESVAALTGEPPFVIDRNLDRLAAAHLIQTRASGRYSLHDLLRLYAGERANHDDTKEDRQAATTALFGYYVSRADDAADRLYPLVLRLSREGSGENTFSSDTEARTWLQAETLSLIAAIRQAASDGPNPMTWKLVDALRGHFAYSQAEEWPMLAKLALDAAEGANQPDARVAAHNTLAGANFAQARYGRAATGFRAARNLARTLGNRRREVVALENLAAVYIVVGDLTKAAEALAEMVPLNPPSNQVNLRNLGVLYEYRGQLDEAAAIHRRVLAEDGGCESRYLLARVESRAERFSEALSVVDASLKEARSIGDCWTEAHALALLGAIKSRTGDLVQALSAAEAAVGLAVERAGSVSEIAGRATLAMVNRVMGDERRALQQYQLALRLARRLGMRFQECEILIGLTDTYSQMGLRRDAEDNRHAALRLASKQGYRGLELTCKALLAP